MKIPVYIDPNKLDFPKIGSMHPIYRLKRKRSWMKKENGDYSLNTTTLYMNQRKRKWYKRISNKSRRRW